MISLNGIFPPLPSSFDKDENLTAGKMRNNIEMLNSYDLSGFLVLGSNGEAVHLSAKEKAKVFDTARDVIPADKLMISGTGCQSTRETIELTKAAVKAGSDAVLVLNPFYYKGLMNRDVLKSHYHAIADASGVPVIIYNMPANTGIDMSADDIAEISAHPNILGLKDSGGNIVKLGDIRNKVRKDFQILAGSAGFLLPALSIGATGGILASANIAPQQCINLYKAFNTGDIDKARNIQLNLIPVNDAVTKRWGVPALKAAMDHLGLYGGPSRSPVMPLTAEVHHQLLQILDKHNINKL